MDTDGQRQYPDGDGDFSNSLNFNFNDSNLKFDNRYLDNANDNYGSGSLFLPKSPLFYERCLIRHLSGYLAEDLIHPPSILPISSI